MAKVTIINGYRYRGIRRFTDRHDKVRYYYRPTGTALPDPAKGFRQFDQAYWAAVEGKEAKQKLVKPRPETSRLGTIEKAVRDYVNSQVFSKLAPDTQGSRRRLLERWSEGAIGHALVATLRAEDIQQGMQNRKATPPAANNWLNAVRQLLDYCVECKRYGIKINVATGVKRLKVEKTGGFPDWTEIDVVQFEKRWSKGTMQYRALHVLLALGQRRSDAVRFSWAMVTADNMVEFTQQKTQTKMRLPLPEWLIEVLPPRDNVVDLHGKPTPFLQNSKGAFTASYFTMWFHAACIEAGLPHLSTHGTRKLAAKRLRKEHCPLELIMAFTGHKSENQLRVYLGDVEREEMADELRNWVR